LTLEAWRSAVPAGILDACRLRLEACRLQLGAFFFQLSTLHNALGA